MTIREIKQKLCTRREGNRERKRERERKRGEGKETYFNDLSIVSSACNNGQKENALHDEADTRNAQRQLKWISTNDLQHEMRRKIKFISIIYVYNTHIHLLHMRVRVCVCVSAGCFSFSLICAAWAMASTRWGRLMQRQVVKNCCVLPCVCVWVSMCVSVCVRACACVWVCLFYIHLGSVQKLKAK